MRPPEAGVNGTAIQTHGAAAWMIGFCLIFFFHSHSWAQEPPEPQSKELSSEAARSISEEAEPIEEELIIGGKKAKKSVGEAKEAKKSVREAGLPAETSEKPTEWRSPYATTEEFMLPREAALVRQEFTSTEPLLTGGRLIEEQALFEDLARRDEQALYSAVRGFEEKPWWRDILESLSGLLNYKQGFYSNYFNNRATHRLLTETPFFGGRAKRWGVLSLDMNYFGSLERLSFEPITIDPHLAKTHGGQAKALYRPSERFHLLITENVRKSNKIVGVEGNASNISLGNNTASNTVSGEVRYFFTQRNVLDLNYDIDYSRTASQDALRITRGYKSKASFLRKFGSRVIVRASYMFDYVKSTDPPTAATSTAVATDTGKQTSFRYEPGIGGTFVIGKRLTFDVDFYKQRFRFRGENVASKGNKMKLKLNHRLSSRFSHGYELNYSDVEGKRSSISAVNNRLDSSFESFSVGGQYNYQLTPRITLSVSADYTRTDPNTPDAEGNNRKKVSVELRRPLYPNRLDLVLGYVFDKNTGALSSSYFSHAITITVKTNFGAGRAS
mgnify:CR=1 FL=1